MSLPALTPLEHAAFVAAGLLTYIVITRVRRQRRHPYAALAWVMGIAAFPYLGLPLFLVFGTRKVVRPATQRQPMPAGPWAAMAPDWATRLLAALGAAGARPQAAVRFQAEGEHALQAVQAVIGSARHTLDLCTYVLGDDEVGALIAAALAERARAGVRVRLLVDSIGSLKSAHSHDELLKRAGVHTRLFMPALGSPGRGRVNLRNHRKLLIADGARVVGRAQPGQRILHWPRGRAALAGPELHRRGRAGRAGAGTVRRRLAHRPRRAPGAAPGLCRAAGAAGRGAGRRHPCHADTLPAELLPADVALAQWVPSGPDFHEDILHALLVSAAFHAEQRLLLATPYFVPDEGLQEALVLAAKRGLQITLLLPRQSNHRLADWARGRAVRELVEAGVNVRLLPAMLHAKAVVVDDVLALCGSANLDSRSLFINYEAMAAFYGRAQIDWLADWITRTAADGEPASSKPPSWLRDIGEGIVATVAFQL
ncbi:phospholipase D-like domain-containing protein [Ottowia beijingensis]|uniref:phospholipase D-like domain-containing protein n=1 Tax=Ottowia beijingensis TaxID=1207057 RepID=UPI00214DA8EE|nr:phospholipase D-like domain-containing protein [Ottowia beijingensis]